MKRHTKDLLFVLLVAWGVLVLFLFLRNSFHLAGSTLGTLSTLGIGLCSAYAFWFLGYRLWRRLRAHVSEELDSFEASAIELGLGLSLVMAAMFLAGVFHLYKPWLVYGLLVVMLIGPHAAFLREVRGRFSRLLARERRPAFVPITLLTLMGVMTLIASLTPVISQDALVYHLAVPDRYVDHGGFLYLPGNFFAQFPQNVEMLFTFGLLLDGEELAHWYHWLLTVAATVAVAAFSRRLDSRASGLLAAAVFATIPTVALIAGWAYIDLGVVFFILLSSLCFLLWWRSQEACWIILAAVFAGVAAGCKYTGGFQGLVLVGGVIAFAAARRWSVLKITGHLSLVAGVVALVASPWWIKNIIYTGNPLYPFCYEIFGGANWDQERSEVLSLALKGWGGAHGFIETLFLPWRLTMSGRFFSESNFDGVIGCVFLIAVPVIVGSFWVSREHRLVLGILFAYAAFWVVTTRQVRFLLPALAMAAALIGATVPALLARGWSRRAMTGTLYCAMAFNVLVASLHFAYHNPLLVALGLESKGQFLEREIPGGDYRVFEFIERELPADSYILLGSLGNPGFLVKRPYYSDALFENHTLARMLAGCDTPGATLEVFQRRGFTHFLFRWDTVFDPEGIKSEIPLDDQKKLMRFLNGHARQLIRVGGTCLYEIRSDG